MKKMNKKGFTLAELLIVVAIIAVLVAIAIPVFSAQLEKSRIATDKANVRSWYGEVVANYLSDDSYTVPSSYSGKALEADKGSATVTISGDMASGTYQVVYNNNSNDGLTLP